MNGPPMTVVRILIGFVVFGPLVALPVIGSPVRVACIGNSITAGALLEDSARDSYPAVLVRLLGAEYEVGNFGASGSTMLRTGDKPYWNERQFREAAEFEPEIAVIELGTNDSKAENWDVHGRTFAADAEAIIAHFAALPSRPEVWVCLPLPVYADVGGIRERALTRIRDALRNAALRQGARVIDTHNVFAGKPGLLADGVHPNAAGAELLAQAVASAVTMPSTFRTPE